jgi:HSP20 family protein
MMLDRYDPFATLQRFSDTFNRALEQSGLGGRLDASRGTAWAPPVDVYEDAERLSFKFDVPDVKKEDLNVRFENGVLTVEGSRKLEFENRAQNYHRVERVHGKFARSFSLPSTVSPERIHAELRDGVLSLTLPKRPEAQPRSIEIKS